MPPHKSALVPNLDFLRACAVLFVLVDHTLLAFNINAIGGLEMGWLGRTGVLFFFVHTCCVLMMSLERHKGERFYSDFYLRRIFRIYPLSILAVLLAMIPPHNPKLTRLEWLSNLTLTQNLTGSHDAIGPLWTLPLEVQMYFFLPFVYLLVSRAKSLRPMIALLVAAVVIAVLLPSQMGYVKVFKFAPAFLAGAIAYWLFRNRSAFLPAWGLAVTIAVIAIAFLSHPDLEFSAWLACFVLGVIVPFFRQIQNRYINATAFQIAKYSYGVYLSHALLLTWMRPTVAMIPLYLVAVAGASVASYHLIEHPMVRLSQKLTARPNSRAAEMTSHSAA
jgi:peptidoglycan/LPS O-acetylase OafA/YrhL